MKTHQLHAWNVTPENAQAIQRNLRAWIITEGTFPTVKWAGRIQLSTNASTVAPYCSVQAVISIHNQSSRQLLERKAAIKPSRFPLIPGLYSFNRVPAIITALEKLRRTPDIFFCDGRGITGKNSFGVASHVGLITNVPTVGIRTLKSQLETSVLGRERGCWLPVIDNGQQAAILRVVEDEQPVLISPAHRINLEGALRAVLDYIPMELNSAEYQRALYSESGHPERQPSQFRLIQHPASGN